MPTPGFTVATPCTDSRDPSPWRSWNPPGASPCWPSTGSASNNSNAPQADRLLFATAPATLARLGGFDASIDPQALYDYLYCYIIPSPRTIYRGLRKLPASYCLEWRDGVLRVEPHWVPQFEETPIDAASAGREMLESIEAAVRRDAAEVPAAQLGAFLSGGLDSSTVAGMLARAAPPAHTYGSLGIAGV